MTGIARTIARLAGITSTHTPTPDTATTWSINNTEPTVLTGQVTGTNDDAIAAEVTAIAKTTGACCYVTADGANVQIAAIIDTPGEELHVTGYVTEARIGGDVR